MGSTTPRLLAPVPVADAERVLAARDAVVVDLRSPSEFAEDRLPGAVNVPLFDDVQRALIGTLYAQRSPDAAFAEGRELVAARIEALVAEIARHAGWRVAETDLAERVRAMTAGGIAALEVELGARRVDALPARPVVLHCWRGGLRSRSVIAFVRALESVPASERARVVGLEGGYKGYRARVRAELDGWSAPPAVALRGLTGVGKTLVLRELERQRPGWTLDLEGCAGHRSSLLGMVGLEPRSQKGFETALAARLRRGFEGVVVMEGESRKVGDAVVPERVWAALEGAANVELVAGVERRVRVLVDDYLARPECRGELRAQLAKVEERMARRAGLVELLDAGAEAELVRVLLEHYYDPLYRHSERDKRYALTVDAEDPARAAAEIAAWVEASLPSAGPSSATSAGASAGASTETGR